MIPRYKSTPAVLQVPACFWKKKSSATVSRNQCLDRSSCQTCAKSNPQGALQRHQPLHQLQRHQLQGHQPGEDWQVGFTHIPTHKAPMSPNSSETADVMAQVLLEHIILRSVVPSQAPGTLVLIAFF